MEEIEKWLSWAVAEASSQAGSSARPPLWEIGEAESKPSTKEATKVGTKVLKGALGSGSR